MYCICWYLYFLSSRSKSVKRVNAEKITLKSLFREDIVQPRAATSWAVFRPLTSMRKTEDGDVPTRTRYGYEKHSLNHHVCTYYYTFIGTSSN